MDPAAIVDRMLANDHFSRWLGIDLLELSDGACELAMSIRKEMLNGFGIAHGGISYSLADSALAFASNSRGMQSVSIETSISHVASLKEGDRLHARAKLVTETNRLGHYDIVLWTDDPGNPVALFRGMVYKTEKRWQNLP